MRIKLIERDTGATLKAYDVRRLVDALNKSKGIDQHGAEFSVRYDTLQDAIDVLEQIAQQMEA